MIRQMLLVFGSKTTEFISHDSKGTHHHHDITVDADLAEVVFVRFLLRKIIDFLRGHIRGNFIGNLH